MPKSQYDQAIKLCGFFLFIAHIISSGLQFGVEKQIIFPWWGWLILFLVLALKEILVSRTIKKCISECCGCSCCGTCLSWILTIGGFVFLFVKQLMKCSIYDELSGCAMGEFWVNWVVVLLYTLKIAAMGLMQNEKTRLYSRNQGQYSRQQI